MNKIKLLTLISVLCLLIIIPVSFAADGETAIADDDATSNMTLTSGDSSEILSANYYFDSNAENDSGDGSISNPYKELKSNRIASNSNLYFANGEYTLDKSSTINNVTIIGQNPSQTILKYYGTGFTVSSSLTLQNVTLVNLRIINNGNIEATNTIFKDSKSTSLNGGVIESQKADSNIVLNNCIFNNTSAKSGGAIYLKQGALNITDSLFIDNSAVENGGAISASSDSVIHIGESKFLNGNSDYDGGGAIYLFDSDLIANNLEINNCSSTFGGAISSIKSNVNLHNFTGKNNKAKYDGGAIYAIYQKLFMFDSLLENNTAENAGAVFVYDIDDFLVETTRFIKNHANSYAGAFYSAFLPEPYYDSILDPAIGNSFSNNTAKYENDVLEEDIPSLFIGSGDCIFVLANFSDVSSIPSRYDLRELGQVTSVKNQGSNGNCWAFSALGALESNILKATGIELDLSEENMKNLMAMYSMYGWNIETNSGGYDSMSYSYLASWLGPLNESDDTYKLNSILSPVLNSLFHIQNVLFLKRENYTDNDGIKLAVMKFGGVSTSMYIQQSTYLKDRKYYYYNGTSGQNHVGVIVGWDDDLEIPDAPDKGAWIVKNSWGSSWAENGFFYVSYYDTKFAEVGKYDSFVFVLNETLKYDKNYQYDAPGKTDVFLNESDVVWYKNRFNATDNEYLAAVSTYFDEGTEWNLSIYVNDKLKLTQSGFETDNSYKTIELNQLIKLNKGDIFEAVFKIKTEGVVAGVPISEYIVNHRTDNHHYINTQFYKQNCSYISYDGKNWQDLCDLEWAYSSHVYYSQVACIKAFTVLNAVGTSLELSVVKYINNTALFKATVKNQYGALVRSGKVTFTVDGKSTAVNVKDGVASLTYLFEGSGIKTVTAKFSATGFVTSRNTTTVDIDKISTELTSSNVRTTYNSGKGIVANLMDDEGNPVVGAEVKIVLGSITEILTTDAGGRVSLSLNGIAPNSYVATITFDGDDIYKKSNTTVNVVITKANMLISAIYDSANKQIVGTLTNKATGKAVASANVKVNIGGVVTPVRSNGKGQVFVSTADLAYGVYTATISYSGNSIYNPASTSIDFSTKNDMIISVVYDAVNKQIVGTLTNNATGRAVASANVKVELNGVNSTVRSNGKGQVFVSTADLAYGVYTATISYSGNSIYNPASTIIVFSVKADMIISVVYDAVNKQIVGTLTNNATGRAVASANVKVNISGVVTPVRSNGKGQVFVSTADLAYGVYTATISYSGNSIYNPACASIDFSTKADMIISDIYGNSTELTATLTNSISGKKIGSANVVVNIGGVTTTVKSNGKGQIKVPVTGSTGDVYSATISYKGNSIYNAVSTTVTVDLTKANMVIAATYDSDNKQITGTLTNSVTGKAVASANVKVDINGVVTTVRSNGKGIITVSTLDLDEGTYVASISYQGNSIYNPSGTVVKVDV